MIRVSVRNFGPIVEGAVALKPLTIFVGPSNAGKSYMAMLVYSLLQSLAPFPVSRYGGLLRHEYFGPGRYFRRGLLLDPEDGSLTPQGISDALNGWLQDADVDPRIPFTTSFPALPTEIREMLERGVVHSLQSIERLFSRELLRCLGEIGDLRSRRVGASPLQIDLERNEPLLRLNLEEHQGAVRVLSSDQWDLTQMTFEAPGRLVSRLRADVSSAASRRRRNLPLSYQQMEFIETLSESVSAWLYQEFPGSCYYLPAARSGIAQGHKVISSILVRQSSLAGIQPLEIPTLSGIITDFMGHILTMEHSRSLFLRADGTDIENVVRFLEREVVGGSIDIERSGEVTYPEILYAPIGGQPNAGTFPLHKTSSMVSELAPVILFLKHLVSPGDLIVIEEPESHLHPAIQRQMARGIARLVNAGVKVIVTTHSDYFIGQLNNLLKLSYVSRQKRTWEGYAATDCLKSDNVAAYHFVLKEELNGSFVRELPIVSGFGIDEEEFAKVSEDLYEESVWLQGVKPK